MTMEKKQGDWIYGNSEVTFWLQNGTLIAEWENIWGEDEVLSVPINIHKKDSLQLFATTIFFDGSTTESHPFSQILEDYLETFKCMGVEHELTITPTHEYLNLNNLLFFTWIKEAKMKRELTFADYTETLRSFESCPQ